MRRTESPSPVAAIAAGTSAESPPESAPNVSSRESRHALWLSLVVRSLRDLVRQTLIWLLKKLPDGAVIAIREDVVLHRSLDYARADLRLEIDSSEEYHVRLLSCGKEPETINWIEASLRPGDVFYDVGANVGAYSLVAAAFGSPSVRVYAFEPNSASFAKLCRNIELNDLQGRIVPLPFALAAQSGLASFQYVSGRPGLASHTVVDGAVANRGAVDRGGVQTVLTAQLDEVVRQYKLPDPNVIKIDVDGGELSVLMGARDGLLRQSLRAILVEVDDTPQAAQRIFAILQSAGFELAGSVQRPSVINHMFVRPGATVRIRGISETRDTHGRL